VEHVDILYERTTGSIVHSLSSRMKKIFATSNRPHFTTKISGKNPCLPHTIAKISLSSYPSPQSSCRQNSTKLAPLRGNRGSRLDSRPNTN